MAFVPSNCLQAGRFASNDESCVGGEEVFADEIRFLKHGLLTYLSSFL